MPASPAPVRLTAPFDPEAVRRLRAGERVRISGSLLAARDAAHQRLHHCLERGEALPVSLHRQGVYYVGPAPAKPGRVIGSAGPTTSGRMDPYTPRLMEEGLLVMIGKGNRSLAVIQAIREHGGAYLAATGGAGALLARHITGYTVLAWPELGPEALALLQVEDFPAVVVVDSLGTDLYAEGRKPYQTVSL